jgi:hypothetical protein
MEEQLILFEQNNLTDSTRPLTSSEKRVIKINQLKAKIQKEQAKLNSAARKERNGQLIALGVLVEVMYQNASREERIRWATDAGKLLSGRNLDRVLGAFKRLEDEEVF